MRIALVAAGVLVAGLVSAVEQSAADKYGVMHKPANGCPAGFVEVADVFQARGRKSPGCVNIRHPWRPLDHLAPGEAWSPVFWGPWGWTKSVWWYGEHAE
jgi:hypothetical protein